MNTMRIPLRLAALAAMLAVAVSAASAAPVYQSDFDADPAADGWTEGAAGTVTYNGTYVVFSGPGGSTQSITRTISTAGFSGLYVDFSFETQGGTESNDTFTFMVDSDNDGTFEPVSSVGGDDLGSPNADPALLPSAAANNPNLPIRMTWDHNYTGEDGLLDRLVIFDAPLTIATDPFDLAPADNGWTETGSVSHGSGEVELGGNPSSFITKTFDFSDYVNILVEIEGDNAGFNNRGDDHVILEIDTGDGFVEVGRQTDGPYPYLLGALLPAEAEGNANVQLRIRADSSAGGQNTLLDQLTVRGQAIPEPGTLALLGLGGLAAVARRRRA